MKRKSALQLRHEFLNRRMEELDPKLIRRMTGHKVSTWNPAYVMQLVGNKSVESHLVYDKPDLKQLRRLLKSRTMAPRLPRRGPRNRPS